MMVYIWLMGAVLNIAFTLLCWGCLNWLAPLFANDRGELPRWLAWVGTFDASLDAGWQDGYFERGRSLWWARVRWLHRNPGYGFAYWLLGIPFDHTQWRVTYRVGTWGTFFWARSTLGHFNLSFNWNGWQLKLGWKAWNYFDGDAADWKPGYQWGPEMRTAHVISPLWYRRPR